MRLLAEEGLIEPALQFALGLFLIDLRHGQCQRAVRKRRNLKLSEAEMVVTGIGDGRERRSGKGKPRCERQQGRGGEKAQSLSASGHDRLLRLDATKLSIQLSVDYPAIMEVIVPETHEIPPVSRSQ
ncbi:hypothetical protein D9M70_537540 [compost metagenome]